MALGALAYVIHVLGRHILNLALIGAAANGSAAWVRVLCALGGETTFMEDGRCALDVAAQNGHAGACAELLRQGASPNGSRAGRT